MTHPNAKQAWAAILVGVLAYNLSAEDGDLLSEQVDRWLELHPVATRLVIGVLAVHLANVVAPRYDIVALGFVGVRKLWCRIRFVQLRGARRSRHVAGCAPST